MDRWMKVALEEAERARAEEEVPIGAVAVLDDEVIARDHNRCIQLRDATAHAEMLVLREAGQVLSIWTRISQIVFGTRDAKAGAVYSKVSLLEPGLFNHLPEVTEGVMAEESREILQRFFAERRTIQR